MGVPSNSCAEPTFLTLLHLFDSLPWATIAAFALAKNSNNPDAGRSARITFRMFARQTGSQGNDTVLRPFAAWRSCERRIIFDVAYITRESPFAKRSRYFSALRPASGRLSPLAEPVTREDNGVQAAFTALPALGKSTSVFATKLKRFAKELSPTQAMIFTMSASP